MIGARVFLPWVIVAAVVIHFAWGVTLLIFPDAGGVTALHTLTLLPWPYPPFILLCVGVAAGVGIVKSSRTKLDSLLVIPQQILLFVSLGDAASAVILGHYGDGTVRPREFIFIDQLPTMIFSVTHALAVLDTYTRVLWTRAKWLQ